MKTLDEVSKGFYESSDVIRYLQFEDMASQLRELVRDDATKYLFKHVAIQAEKCRLKETPDEQMTEDWIYTYSVDVADLLLENATDMVTMFFWLQDVFYDSTNVKEYIYENAEDIVKAYHELFDD